MKQHNPFWVALSVGPDTVTILGVGKDKGVTRRNGEERANPGHPVEVFDLTTPGRELRRQLYGWFLSVDVEVGHAEQLVKDTLHGLVKFLEEAAALPPN